MTMQSKVKCPSEPPRRPNGTVESKVVSLYVCSETPQKLQRGINLVTLCLSLAFFAGASNFIGNQGNVTDLAALNRSIEGLGEQFWLTHSDKFLSDDLFVVPGPVNIKDLHRHTVGAQHNVRPVNVKWHPSRPLVDSDTMDDLTIEPSAKVYVTVAVYKRSNTAQILPSGIKGDIHVSDSDNDTKFQAAATDTAKVTGKHLDPTNVDKLIRVQHWALDNQDRAHAINNPDVDQDDQTQEPDRTPKQAPNIAFEPEYFVGDFVMFEQAGTDNLIDDDIRTMIQKLFDWLYSLPSKQASTSEACKQLHNQNADYKKILKSIGGIRKLLYYTASIEFVIKQAIGGNNFLRIVGNRNAPLFNLDRLGGKYAVGQVSFIPSDDDAYEVLLYDRKSKKSSWDKPLQSVVIEGQKHIRIIPPDLIKCKISLQNNKISREGIATLESLQLLLVYFSGTI